MKLFVFSTAALITGVVSMLVLVPFGQAQESDYEIQLLEHGGRQFRARVDKRTGSPVWVLDVDSIKAHFESKTSRSSIIEEWS